MKVLHFQCTQFCSTMYKVCIVSLLKQKLFNDEVLIGRTVKSHLAATLIIQPPHYSGQIWKVQFSILSHRIKFC